jgi:uncharacterized protein (DUF486 family)
MRTIIIIVSLLIASNVFMTFAWYAHLRNCPTAQVRGRVRELGHRAVRVPAGPRGHDFLNDSELRERELMKPDSIGGAVFFIFR